MEAFRGDDYDDDDGSDAKHAFVRFGDFAALVNNETFWVVSDFIHVLIKIVLKKITEKMQLRNATLLQLYCNSLAKTKRNFRLSLSQGGAKNNAHR